MGNRGFTLVEVLIVSVITGMLLLVLSTVMIMGSKTYNTNFSLYQDFSTLQTATQAITQALRENDAQSVSVTNNGRTLNIGLASFAFSQSALVKTSSPDIQVIANNVSGSFSEYPNDSSGQATKVRVVISLHNAQDPSKYLSSTVTIYPANAPP